MDYKEYLKFYPDFPIKGVNFVDIIPLMQDKALFRSLITDLGALCASPNILAPEARGFLFGAPLLIGTDNIQRMIPLRKKGKLPHAEGDLICVDIIKEYGKDQVFYRRSDLVACIAEDGFINVTFFDDVLATGGTAEGIIQSLNSQVVTIEGKTYPVRVTDCVFLVELDDLCGRVKLEPIAPVKSLIHL